MSVAKVIEITSSSKKSFEDAVSSGIARVTPIFLTQEAK